MKDIFSRPTGGQPWLVGQKKNEEQKNKNTDTKTNTDTKDQEQNKKTNALFN